MLVVGVDPSAKKIALVGYEDFTNSVVVESKSLYPKGTTSQTPETLAIAQTWMESVILSIVDLAPEGQRFAYVEKPLVGRGGIGATIKQAYVGGVIRACLAAHGFAVYDAHPSTWRAGLGIKAKGTVAQKAAALSIVTTQMSKAMPRIGSDGDLADAAAICLYGRSLSGRPPELARSTLQRKRRA